MASGTIQLPPDSSGKVLDTNQLTVSATTVQRQNVALADPTTAAAVAAVSNAALAGTEYGLVVRQVPSASTLAVVANPANATGVTVTLPAVAAQFHYVTRVRIARNATAALTGSAQLQVTTTNLPGSLTFEVGNAMAIGATQIDMDTSFGAYPLKSSAVNTNTTFVFPSAGSGVRWSIQVFYFAAP